MELDLIECRILFGISLHLESEKNTLCYLASFNQSEVVDFLGHALLRCEGWGWVGGGGMAPIWQVGIARVVLYLLGRLIISWFLIKGLQHSSDNRL